jgi:hypothetical protein
MGLPLHWRSTCGATACFPVERCNRDVNRGRIAYGLLVLSLLTLVGCGSAPRPQPTPIELTRRSPSDLRDVRTLEHVLRRTPSFADASYGPITAVWCDPDEREDVGVFEFGDQVDMSRFASGDTFWLCGARSDEATSCCTVVVVSGDGHAWDTFESCNPGAGDYGCDPVSSRFGQTPHADVRAPFE